MSRITMSILVLLLVLFAGCVSTNVLNNETPPSFKSGVETFMANHSGSKLSDKDKSIMVKAASDLEKAMPEPGLKMGAKAPDFVLSNAFGKKVKLSEQLEDGPVVLTFYRGAWCPFCNIELNTLQGSFLKSCMNCIRMNLNLILLIIMVKTVLVYRCREPLLLTRMG